MYGLQVNAPRLPGTARPGTVPLAETPAQHIRNALQLLREVALAGELSTGATEDLGAAIERLHRAVGLLERQRR